MVFFPQRHFRFLILIFSLFYFVPTALLASKSGEVAHSKGVLALSDQRYEEALRFFKTAHQENKANPDSAYFLGLTYLKLKRFSEASKTFQELLEQHPAYSRAYFHYALALYAEKRGEDSYVWFQKAQKTEPTAKDWLKKIEKGRKEVAVKPEEKEKKKPKRWKLEASTAVFYDSNVILDPTNEDLSGFGKTEEDFLTAHTLDAGFSFVTKKNAEVSLNYSAYQDNHLNLYFEDSRFNYGLHDIHIDWQQGISKDTRFRLLGHYMLTTLGSHKYSQSSLGDAFFDLKWKKHWLTVFSGHFKVTHFFSTPSNRSQRRDALQPVFRLEQYFFLPSNPKFFFKGGYEVTLNYAEGADWDYETHKFLLGFHAPLFWKLEYLFLGDIGDTGLLGDFDNVDSTFNRRRNDFTLQLTNLFTRKIVPHLKGSLNYTFAMADSNIGRFSYKRNMVGLTLKAEL